MSLPTGAPLDGYTFFGGMKLGAANFAKMRGEGKLTFGDYYGTFPVAGPGRSSACPISSEKPVWSGSNDMYVKGDTTDSAYLNYVRKATNLDDNPVMNLLFSTENVNHIHKSIIDEVKKIRGITVSRQSDNELLPIMVNFYVYSLSTGSQGNGNFGGWPSGNCIFQDMIQKLNKAVIQECVKQVLSGIDIYLDYTKHKTTMPLPLELPTQTSSKGANVLTNSIGLTHGNDNYAVNQYNTQAALPPMDNTLRFDRLYVPSRGKI